MKEKFLNMKFIDTHAHLNFKEFENDWKKIIKKCQELKIGIINVGIDYQTSKKAIEIAKGYKNVFSAIGLHPLSNLKEFNSQKFLNLAKNKKVVAFGEIGLDYYRAQNKTSQIKVLLAQIKLAQKLNLPVIFHCRDAYQDLLEILKKFPTLKGVIHCFCGKIEIAKKFLKLGFYLGFNGLITYSELYQKTLSKIPVERILLETDCPYLTPIPYKHQRNDPTYIPVIAEKISEVKKISLKDLAKITTENAKRLFSL